MLAGRSTNDGMAAFVASSILDAMLQSEHREAAGRLTGLCPRPRVNILGLSYKENVSDIRNSKVADIFGRLTLAGLECFVHDPKAVPQAAADVYGIHLTSWEELTQAEALLLAVPHQAYREMGLDGLEAVSQSCDTQRATCPRP